MLQFGLFILVNAMLFLRPAELIPGLESAPLYEVSILAALTVSANHILRHLKEASEGQHPTTTFVFGFWVAVGLSHVTSGTPGEAVASGYMFLKIVLFYLLVVANLQTVKRIRAFLLWLCILLLLQVSFGLLQYFEFVNIEALEQYVQREYDPATGALVASTPRLCGAGIFHDPNDLCVLLAIGAIFTLYQLTDRRLGAFRFAWALPMGVVVCAIPLTHSRGGLLALLAGLGTLTIVRLGRRRGLILLALLLPVLLVALGGRMTRFEVDDADDTSQHRMRAWSDGLLAFRQSPLFGIGQGKYDQVAGLVAHNTYIESYTELGFFGGTCFVAAFGYTGFCLIRLRRPLNSPQTRELARLCPYLLAAVAALLMGMMSLSRGYTQPTYLILGLTTAYLRLAGAHAPHATPRLTSELVLRWVGISGLSFATLQLVTVTFVRWS